MNWNENKSLLLTHIFVIVFAGALVIGCAAAPLIFKVFTEYRGGYLLDKTPHFLTSTYTTAVPVAIALHSLHCLLANLRREQIFIQKNVSYLRRISWCCFASAFIFLISSFYYLPFVFLMTAAAFMGLILRVLKNTFERAVLLQEENDYTI